MYADYRCGIYIWLLTTGLVLSLPVPALIPGLPLACCWLFTVPVIAEQAEITAEAFPAEWRPVRLGRGSPRYLDDSDCELVEQFNEQILSMLNVRAIEDKSKCIPHNFSLNSPDLTATLLMPVS